MILVELASVVGATVVGCTWVSLHYVRDLLKREPASDVPQLSPIIDIDPDDADPEDVDAIELAGLRKALPKIISSYTKHLGDGMPASAESDRRAIREVRARIDEIEGRKKIGNGGPWEPG